MLQLRNSRKILIFWRLGDFEKWRNYFFYFQISGSKKMFSGPIHRKKVDFAVQWYVQHSGDTWRKGWQIQSILFGIYALSYHF